MKSIKYEIKKKGNIINIKFNDYNLICLIVVFMIISSGESKYKLTKLNSYSEISEIMNHIQGKGKQAILNREYKNTWNKYFNYIPSKIYINNILQNETNFDYNITLDKDDIKLVFNESLRDCNFMFFGLSNITKLISQNLILQKFLKWLVLMEDALN